MRSIQRMTDGLIARIVPQAEAKAAGEYRCFTSPCPQSSAMYSYYYRKSSTSAWVFQRCCYF